MQPGDPSADEAQCLCEASCSLHHTDLMHVHVDTLLHRTLCSHGCLCAAHSGYLGSGREPCSLCAWVASPSTLPSHVLLKGPTALRKGIWCHCLPGHCATGPFQPHGLVGVRGGAGGPQCARPPEPSGSQHPWWAWQNWPLTERRGKHERCGDSAGLT